MESPSPSSLTTSSNKTRQEPQTHNKRIKKQQQSKRVISAWKSESTQRVYSTKLLHALSQKQSIISTVKQTADRVLAAAARGNTRWSRAITTDHRVHLKHVLHKRHKKRRVAAAPMHKLKEKKIKYVKRKVKILGRLVPGCRKETLPVILEEASDYIPALEMQVRAMRDILSRLSLAGTGSVRLGSESPVPENGVA